MFGASPFIYWSVNLIFDYLVYLVTAGIIMTVIGTVENSYKDKAADLTVVVLPYGFLAITFTYLLSLLFRKAKGIVLFTVVAFLVTVGAGLAIAMFQTKAWGVEHFLWARPLSSVLCILPPYYIVDSIVTILCEKLGAYDEVGLSLYSFEVLGNRLAIAIGAGLFYFFLVVILDYADIRFSCESRGQKHGDEHQAQAAAADGAVALEEQRVESEQARGDRLIVTNLKKTYPGKQESAVSGITFGVPQSECFGLLGLNGAGKTSTFQMLTGYLKPDSGKAMLAGRDLSSWGWDRFQGISYCPQENTLFGSLTVKQHLNLVASIRGLNGREKQQTVDALIEEIGLQEQLSKRASQLSGGNKRKLQFAIALIGYRPLIFLDEPTTGMDPSARRNAWNAIRNAVSRGCTVILTSHSMEECEALCH